MVRRAVQLFVVRSSHDCSLDRQVLVFGDCAVNVTPDREQLATIAGQSADTAKAFGVDPPLVALLSYSTGVSGSGPEVEKVSLCADRVLLESLERAQSMATHTGSPPAWVAYTVENQISKSCQATNSSICKD